MSTHTFPLFASTTCTHEVHLILIKLNSSSQQVTISLDKDILWLIREMLTIKHHAKLCINYCFK